MSGYVVDEDAYLQHYGIRRRSGRYPWGSGGSEEARSRDFLGMVSELRKKGLSQTQIADALNVKIQEIDPSSPKFTTTDLRATTTIARNKNTAALISRAEHLKYQEGYSNGAIAEKMGLSGESRVRQLLEPGAKIRTDKLTTLSNMLRDEVDKKGFVDVGIGVERYTGNSRTQFDTALANLKSEGYKVIKVQTPQVTGGPNKTTIKVLAPEGTSYKDIVTNMDKIRPIDAYSPDGIDWEPIHPPLSLDSKRVGIRYGDQGGTEADGTIYVRPGAKDLDMGGAQYAQVRIAVDGTHYIKGMAVYKKDLPPGVDVVFNTNKKDTGNKLDALKPMNTTPDGKLDIENPFGASIKPGGQRGHLNIVNEEGDWHEWSRNLASQMLSKQRPTLAQEQLNKAYKSKKQEFDEINALTNPAVKKKLLQSYSDDVDSAAVHLKAAAMPKQATQVIMPVGSLKPSEIYAPNFDHGETVVLVRYPHGGKFEIPQLTVNNRNKEAIDLLGSSPKDAVGIHHKTAEQLSGADFDGDTVLVIPNKSGKIQTQSPLRELRNFDPKTEFPPYDGMKTIHGGIYSEKTKKAEFPPGTKATNRKQTEMGQVSNLITDMTIKNANDHEIARAVKHSMVVIDAEKHNLNFRQSYLDNNIAELKTKYQGGANRGASTLISLSGSEARPNHRKTSFRIDKATGEKVYQYTGEGYTNSKGVFVPRTIKSTKGAETKNAHELSSGTKMEEIYANHANGLKTLANEARRVMVNTPSTPMSQSAKKVYAPQVESLKTKLDLALKNAPKERMAQIVANTIVKQKTQDNPQWDADDIKKAQGKALVEARVRMKAGKELIDITPIEWEAIQAGAISTNQLENILNNTNIELVKKLATPRAGIKMTTTMRSRADALLAAGRPASEVANILGVSVSTIYSKEEENNS